MFGFQFFIQSGVFFTIPLFLSVVLELNALQTGLRLLPLSLALLVVGPGRPAAVARAPRPAGWCGIGLLSMLVGTLLLVGRTDPGADAAIVLIPMALMGLGIGALASQLGRGHRVGVPGHDERRGRRPAEHLHQLRRLARNRPGRCRAHRQPHDHLPHRCLQQQRHPAGGREPGHRSSSRPASPSSPTPT